MRQLTGLFPTDSLPPFLQIEVIHLLLKARFILRVNWLMPWVWIIKHFFLGWWILSLTFFSSKIFVCFFISLSFLKEYGGGGERGGQEAGAWRWQSFGRGRLWGGQLTLVQYFLWKKNTILTQLMCSFCKRSINLEETISTRLPTTIVTHVLHNNSWLFKRWITTLFTRLSG